MLWNESIQRHSVRERDIATHLDRILWDLECGQLVKFRFFEQNIRIVSFRSVAIDSYGNQFKFCLREAFVVTKVAKSFDRAPWWHSSRKHRFLDLDGARLHIAISHQRKGRTIFVMARCATLVNDAGYFSI